MIMHASSGLFWECAESALLFADLPIESGQYLVVNQTFQNCISLLAEVLSVALCNRQGSFARFLKCFRGNHQEMAPVGRNAHRWIRPDVYPLFAAVGLGITAAAVIMSRKLTAVRRDLSHDAEPHQARQF